MEKHTLAIQTYILSKKENNQAWENEYGIYNGEKHGIDTYYSTNDFKVQYIQKNDLTLFKIVPTYFQIPHNGYFWEYYDGYIKNGKIRWNEYKEKNI